ncbi:hypothetical protein V6Z11_A13G121000 [Gossypium hirsutum]
MVVNFLLWHPPKENRKRVLNTVACLSLGVNVTWCNMGDFNVVKFQQKKKKGGRLVVLNSCKDFEGCTEGCDLMELIVSRVGLTWFNNRVHLGKKLDIFFFNIPLSDLFPNVFSKAELMIESDHKPIVIFLKHTKKNMKGFKFEYKWTLDPKIDYIIKHT